MQRYKSISLANVLGLGLGATAHAAPAPIIFGPAEPGIVEHNPEPFTVRIVEQAPSELLLALRRGDGARTIRHWDGSSWATFLDEGYPMDMHATRSDVSLVCAPVAGDYPSTTGIISECAVRSGAGFSSRYSFPGSPSSFIHDVCPLPGGGFDVLVLQGNSPLGFPGPNDDAPVSDCVEFSWTAQDGWVEGPHGGCNCELRDGMPCQDPCYGGQAEWRGGECVPIADAWPFCDDGDPYTIDQCNGHTTRCLESHPEFDQPLLFETVGLNEDGELVDTIVEYTCAPDDPGCQCFCFEGDEHCEVLSDSDDLVDRMCTHIETDRSAPLFRRGDADGDGSHTLADSVVILRYLFQGGPAPGCLDAADFDDSGTLELTDAVALLARLFSGGVPPAEPFWQCGIDITPSGLGCETSTAVCCEMTEAGCE